MTDRRANHSILLSHPAAASSQTMLLNEDKSKWGLDSHSPGWTARVVCSGRQGQLTRKSVGPGAWRERGLQALTSRGPNDSRSLLANKGDPSASILDHLSIRWEVEKASCESKLFPGKAARHSVTTRSFWISIPFPLPPLSCWEKSYISQFYIQPGFPTLLRFLLASKTTWPTLPLPPAPRVSLKT